MSFQLDQVVPWGRSFDEYRRMFALTSDDLGRRILGCADGPAAFHATLHERGGAVTSCDPLYRFSAAEIEQRIEDCFPIVLRQAEENASAFCWEPPISDVVSLGRVRRAAMDRFLRDYPRGRAEGRYVAEELPRLSFADRSFHLALCSHFLFLYASLGESFHEQSLRELLRVAGEVRVFPLLGLDGQPPPFLDSIVARFRQEGFGVSVERVPYEFQRGAHSMLRLRHESRVPERA